MESVSKSGVNYYLRKFLRGAQKIFPSPARFFSVGEGEGASLRRGRPPRTPTLSHAEEVHGRGGIGSFALGRGHRPALSAVGILALVAIVGLAGCEHKEQAGGTADKPGQTAEKAADVAAKEATPAGPTDWNAAALQTAEQVAGKVRAAGVPCDEYGPQEFAMYDADYQKRLPMAAAVASCTSEGDEDLTFEVFEDAKKAQEFIAAKQAMLCKRAKEMNLVGFPGFAYVDGGAWIIEPDEKETADKLAPLLGGKSAVAGCATS